MEEQTLYGRKSTFKLPSGYEVTIREQNGEDDDILSNPVEAKTLMNISRFLSGIVVDTDYNSRRKLSPEDIQNMPSLDRYVILMNSRIFSIGKELEFDYDWSTGEGKHDTIGYTLDLDEEFLFDYSTTPTEEEMEAKPRAIPFYPSGKQQKDLKITTSSGKELTFDLLNATGEAYVLGLPDSERTKNQELIARNLKLKVGDQYEVVKNFRMFSVKDMLEIRSHIRAYDPVFPGLTEIKHPVSGKAILIPVLGLDNFFFPREN